MVIGKLIVNNETGKGYLHEALCFQNTSKDKIIKKILFLFEERKMDVAL